MEPENTTNDGFMLSPKWYNRSRFFVQIVLPAVSTFYITLGNVWGLPAVDKVVTTLVALTTFLGIVLGVSRKNYNTSDKPFVGNIVVHEKEGGGVIYSLEYNGDPADLQHLDTATFKVGAALPPPG